MVDTPLPVTALPRRSCQTCGFLAVQQYRGVDNTENLAANTMLFDVGEDARRWGRVFRVRTPGKNGNDNGNPVCVKNVLHLQKEMGYRVCVDADCTPRALAFFERPMDCQHWIQYTPGLSPEGHLWQSELLRLAKGLEDFLDGQRKDTQEFFKGQLRKMDDSSSSAFRWQLATAIGVAILGLAVASYQAWLAREQLRLTLPPPTASPLPSTPNPSST